MVLRALLLAALVLSGCKESLFDAHIGEDDDAVGDDVSDIDGGADARVVDGGPDGGEPDIDGGIDGGPADAGIDGGPPILCPDPCVADAVDEYSPSAQGNPWRYRAGSRSRDGVDLVDLTAGKIAGLTGWKSAGTPAAGIASCVGSAAPACAGLNGYLLVVPSGAGSGLRDPALEVTVEENGLYRVSGELRLATGTPAGVQQKLLVYRNGRHDVIVRQLFTPSTTPTTFDLEVEAVAGDRLIVELKPMASGTASPLGLRLYVSGGDGFPGECQYTLRFDGDVLVDDCAGITWNNEGGSVKTGSLDPSFGDARSIVEEQHFAALSGPVIKRQGDFTVQWWFKDAPNQGIQLEPVFSDIECADKGGFWLTLYPEGGTDNWDMAWAYHDNGADYCQFTPFERLAWTQPIEYTDWHFYRIVRSTADEEMTVCVDGKEVSSTPVDAGWNLSSTEKPHLGQNSSFGAARTTGTYDDFRVFTRALPCTGLP